MQHRGTARTRIVKLRNPDGFAAEAGAAVTAGPRVIGKAGSGAGGIGLAIVRLDKLDDALAAGEPVLAGGLAFSVDR
jgi:folate-binding Fe-S cluster repair protein YgfZ